MLVTLYTRGDIQDCKRVRRIVDQLAGEYGLEVTEISANEVEAGAKDAPKGQALGALPAITVAGDSLGVLNSSRGSLSEATIRSYLQLAIAAGTSRASNEAVYDSLVTQARAIGKRDSTRKSDTAQTSAPPGSIYRIKSYLWSHRVGVVVSALSAFLGLAWLSPLLASAGMKDVYSAIFAAYRLVCVQTPERSPMVDGHPCCLCWRCVAIYGGSLVMGILYTLGRDGRLPRMGWLVRPVGLVGLIVFGLPMIADGLTHMFGLRPGVAYAYSADFWLGWGEFKFDWWVRMVTALIATIGAVRFLCPRLDKIAGAYGLRTRSNTIRNVEPIGT